MNIIPYVNRPAPLAWDVAKAIFGATGKALLWEPWDISTLFQDQAGTTPVTAGGDPVGRVLDKSGNSVPLSQSVLANSFTAVRMPLTGRRNLLTWTEDFSNAAWGKTTATVTPLGGGAFTVEGSANNSMIRQLNVQSIQTGHIGVNSVELRRRGALETVRLWILYNGSGTAGSLYKTVTLTDEWVRHDISSVATSGADRQELRISMTTPGAVDVRFPQVELGSVATPYQRVTNANDVREDGVPDVWSIVSDYSGDVLPATLPFAIDGEILIAGTGGTIIEPVSYASGSTFNLGIDTYTGGTPGILRAIGPIVGVVLLDRAFTDTEKAQLIAYYKAKGAKGLLVEGPELNATGLDGFSLGSGWAVNDGVITRSGQTVGSAISKTIFASVDTTSRIYLFKVDASARSGDFTVAVSSPGIDQAALPAGTGTLKAVVGATANRSNMGITGVGTSTITASSISVKELRPQEDW